MSAFAKLLSGSALGTSLPVVAEIQSSRDSFLAAQDYSKIEARVIANLPGMITEDGMVFEWKTGAPARTWRTSDQLQAYAYYGVNGDIIYDPRPEDPSERGRWKARNYWRHYGGTTRSFLDGDQV